MFFFRNLFFARRGRCDGQTQQQNYFSETFLRAIGSFFCRIGVNSRTCMVDEIVTETLLRKWRILIHFHGVIIFISWTTATGHSHPLSIRKQKLWDVSAVDTLVVCPLFLRSMFQFCHTRKGFYVSIWIPTKSNIMNCGRWSYSGCWSFSGVF